MKYTKPVSELEKFDTCDVITTSGPAVDPNAPIQTPDEDLD